jgi:lysophospholipase L1-like esterase
MRVFIIRFALIIGMLSVSACLPDRQADTSRHIVIYGDSLLHAMMQNDPETQQNYFMPVLQKLSDSKNVVLIDRTISGNGFITGDPKATGLGRFKKDALKDPNVTHIIFLMGTNDIVPPGTIHLPKDPPPHAEDLIKAYQKVVAMTHAKEIKIIGGTLLPFKGAYLDSELAQKGPGYFYKDKEHERQIVNHWIRTSGAFDGVIDFDAAVADPKDPERIMPKLDKDHTHPNEKGMRRMAKAISIELLMQ